MIKRSTAKDITEKSSTLQSFGKKINGKHKYYYTLLISITGIHFSDFIR